MPYLQFYIYCGIFLAIFLAETMIAAVTQIVKHDLEVNKKAAIVNYLNVSNEHDIIQLRLQTTRRLRIKFRNKYTCIYKDEMSFQIFTDNTNTNNSFNNLTANKLAECILSRMRLCKNDLRVIEIRTVYNVGLFMHFYGYVFPNVTKIMMKQILPPVRSETDVDATQISLQGSQFCNTFPQIESIVFEQSISYTQYLDVLKTCKKLRNLNLIINFTGSDGFYNMFLPNKHKVFDHVYLKFNFKLDTCPSKDDIKDLGLDDFKFLGKNISFTSNKCSITNSDAGEIYIQNNIFQNIVSTGK